MCSSPHSPGDCLHGERTAVLLYKRTARPRDMQGLPPLTQLGRESRTPVFSTSKVVKMRGDGEQRMELRVCMCEAEV